MAMRTPLDCGGASRQTADQGACSIAPRQTPLPGRSASADRRLLRHINSLIEARKRRDISSRDPGIRLSPAPSDRWPTTRVYPLAISVRAGPRLWHVGQNGQVARSISQHQWSRFRGPSRCRRAMARYSSGAGWQYGHDVRSSRQIVVHQLEVRPRAVPDTALKAVADPERRADPPAQPTADCRADRCYKLFYRRGSLGPSGQRWPQASVRPDSNPRPNQLLRCADVRVNDWG